MHRARRARPRNMLTTTGRSDTEGCARDRTPRNPSHKISRKGIGDILRYPRLSWRRTGPAPGQWRTSAMPFEAALPAYVRPSWSGTASGHRGEYHSSPTSGSDAFTPRACAQCSRYSQSRAIPVAMSSLTSRICSSDWDSRAHSSFDRIRSSGAVITKGFPATVISLRRPNSV